MRSRGYHYEELPVNRSEEALDSMMAQPQHTPPMNGLPNLNLSHNNSRDILMSNNSLTTEFIHSYPRKRHNPLYNSRDHDDEVEKTNRQTGGSLCICVLLFLVLLSSVVAICVSVYAIILHRENSNDPKPAYVITPDSNKTATEEALFKIQQLEQQIDSVNAVLTGLQHAASANAREQEQRYELLSSTVANLSSAANKLRGDISAVSKMEGPQGPPGVGNLSMCEHNSKSGGSLSDQAENESPPVPISTEEAQAWVILGVECATDVGTVSTLESTQMEEGTVREYTQFRCRCSGKQNNNRFRYCVIHVWRCPKIT